MKQSYHIKVSGEERETIDSVFRYLGAEPEFVSSYDGHPEFSIHYIVDLSKYELLYVRLACKTGYCGKINRKDQHEKIPHISSGVHASD